MGMKMGMKMGKWVGYGEGLTSRSILTSVI